MAAGQEGRFESMKPHNHNHSHARPKLPELTERLRRQSRRITGPRQAILEILRHHPHPMSNKEIFVRMAAGDCDLATVYRSMHMLESMGMVKRFDFGDGIARYELVAEGDDGHHHHLICTQCAGVVEIEDCFPEELEQRIAAENGFRAITHKLEFFGVCPGCQGH
jgi:Fur family transcriptional regulator, ferric uptake regulator